MAVLKANFSSILYKEFMKKSYGVVIRKGLTFPRNYKRELKNGKGLTHFEVQYATLPIRMPKLFQNI